MTSKQKSNIGLSKKTHQVIGYVFAGCILVAVVIFLWTTPCPSPAQFQQFKVILSVALAILSGYGLTGSIKIQYKIGIFATGSSAILVILLFLDEPKNIDFLGRCDQQPADSIKYSIQLYDTSTNKTPELNAGAEMMIISGEIHTIDKVSNKLILGVGFGGEFNFYNEKEITKPVHLELFNETKYDLVRQKYMLKKNELNEIFVIKKGAPPQQLPNTPEYKMGGTVFDTNGNTVAKVRVFTMDGKVETKTDINGHFRFSIKTTSKTLDLFFWHKDLGEANGTFAVTRQDIPVTISKRN